MSVTGTVIEEDGFGFVPRPDPTRTGKYTIVKRYTMTNKHGASVQLISWGARIQSIRVPNKNGVLGDVVLGFDTMDGYLRSRYTSGIIGPAVNRVSNGKTRANDPIHALTANDDGGNHFHMPGIDLDNVNWESHVLNKQVVMSYVDEGNEKWPGYLLIQAKYSWTDDNQLRINVRARTTRPRPTNVTNYCLLNLAGHGTGPAELRKHVVAVNGEEPIHDAGDTENLPTGVTRLLQRAVYDLRLPTQLTHGTLRLVPGGGYDRSFRINGPSCYRFHARIIHPGSGRTLEMYSDQPCLWFYTGNELPDPERIYPPDFEDCFEERRTVSSGLGTGIRAYEEFRGKGGICYRRHGGFAVLPGNYPGSESFDQCYPCVLYPGETYAHDTTYRFGVLTTT